MINGVIFDMDGTLLDTERVLIRCWIKSAALHGFEMKEQHALNIRRPAIPLCRAILEACFRGIF